MEDWISHSQTLWLYALISFAIGIWLARLILYKAQEPIDIGVIRPGQEEKTFTLARDDIIVAAFIGFLLTGITPVPYLFESRPGVQIWPMFWALGEALYPRWPFLNPAAQLTMIVVYGGFWGALTTVWFRLLSKGLRWLRGKQAAANARQKTAKRNQSQTPLWVKRFMTLMLFLAAAGHAYQLWAKHFSVEHQLRKILPELNKTLPKTIEGLGRHEPYRANGKTLFLLITLVDSADDEEASPDEIESAKTSVRNTFIKTYCQPFIKQFKRGMVLDYSINDAAGLEVIHSTIDLSNCLSSASLQTPGSQKQGTTEAGDVSI